MLKNKVLWLFTLLVLLITIIGLAFFYTIDTDKRYLKKLGYSNDEIILIKNNKIINEVKNKYKYSKKLIFLLKNKYFILNNLERYMSYDNTNIDLVISMVNSNRDHEYYTNTKRTDTSKGILMLVNKYYYLNKEYVLDNLVEMDLNYSNYENNLINKEAYDAFKDLVNDALKENLYIKCNSAYRSYSYQEGVYNIYSDDYSAKPGFSEHQTGLSLDVGVANDYTDDRFQDTKEYIWMKDNSYKYGFILRYPEGKEDITGYNFEAWHYRYVGREAAKVIYDNNLTFEEYYAYYVDK